MSPPARPPARVRVRLLGPTELAVNGTVIELGGPKLRAILALLALASGRIVPAEELMSGVWGEDLPATARNSLQYHVGVLRKGLAGHGASDALVTRDPGYSLTADTDIALFHERVGVGRQAAEAGRHEAAAAALADALNAWRGPALADLRDFEFAQPRAVALEEQRLTSLELWAETQLACGRADAMLVPLQEVVTENPTRERLWEQLMLALYRTGRQDAALSAYRAARAALDRELGVPPSTRLTALHQAILRQDVRLSPDVPLAAGSAHPLTQTRLAGSELPGVPPTLIGPAGQRVHLGPDGAVLGRHEECDLVLVDDRVSRRHAEVMAAGSGFAVADLGSTNGTLVNGRRISAPVMLVDGDRIEVGHCVVRFVCGSTAEPQS